MNGFGSGLDTRISRDHDHRAAQSSCLDLAQDIDSRPVPQNDVCKYNIKARIVYSGQSFAAAFSSRYDMPCDREEPFEGKPDRFLIIDYKNSRTHFPPRSPLLLAGKSIMTLVNSPLALSKLS